MCATCLEVKKLARDVEMDSIRWAVIGAGGIARRRMIPEGILPTENAELVAVYSPHSGQEVADEVTVHGGSQQIILNDAII